MVLLKREDWDFTEVPDGELAGCCYWEYARESAFIRDTLQRYREWWAEGAKLDKASDELFARTDRIQSIGEISNVIVSGCSFPAEMKWQTNDPDAANYHHPDADPITGSFRTPWQSLSNAERTCRARMATYCKQLIPSAIERGHYCEAEDIAKYCRNRANEIVAEYRRVQQKYPSRSEIQLIEEGKLKPSPGIPPSLFWESGREVTVLRIAWANYTNDELVQAFRQWVRKHRPRKVPVPSNQGHKPGDVRAHLTRLAAMRLLSRFKLFEILNPRRDARFIIWETKQFAGRKWHDATKWHDARREAGQFFRRLFPFLPPEEKPLSWERRSPGK
jgi:hypothetical protein